MRLLALALALLVAGCTLLERPPPIVIKNETASEVTGEAFLYPASPDNATDRLEAKWGFTVPGLAFREVARLPREQGDHRLVIELDDGRTGAGRAVSGTHTFQLLVRVTETGIVVEPQGVK